MAQWTPSALLRRLAARFSGGTPRREPGDARRLQEKYQVLSQATEHWLSLLREMEQNGETTDSRYERYYQAYLQAKQQQQRADLELFNRRQGYSG